MNVDEFVEFYSAVGKVVGCTDAMIYEMYKSCASSDAPYFAAIITGEIDKSKEQGKCRRARAKTLVELYDILTSRQQCVNGTCECLDEYTRRVFIYPMGRRPWPSSRSSCIIELGKLVGSITPCPLSIIPNEQVCSASHSSGRIVQLHWYDSSIKLITPDGNIIDGNQKAKIVASSSLANISCAILNCILVGQSIKAFDVLYMDRDFRSCSSSERVKQLKRIKELAMPVFFGNIRDAITHFASFSLICFDDNFIFSYNLIPWRINHV